MSNSNFNNEGKEYTYEENSAVEESNRYEKLINEGEKRYKLSGMYKEWFLDYASYSILERAIPAVEDGLKPVQRRILHSMKRMDDGRYNKVANIIGHTMQFHPHGDASIGDALVQLGQKDLLIDCQGNWGNTLTGDGAAAPRYIEARLTPFAREVLFNPKTTKWTPSYDGRENEPILLPAKFPILLAMGVEGIAVGLASKIMPHNFNELIEASVAHLKGEEFLLFPDFPSGGMADCSKYNWGVRGSQIKVRAKIEKIDRRSLVIKELPFGLTTSKLIDSIIRANERGIIRVRKIDDNTSSGVEIVIQLQPDTSPDKTIDALYAFTDCEISISPNSTVIVENHPHFIGVDQILKSSCLRTKSLLEEELKIELEELSNSWHYSSIEKIFFEERIYRLLENRANSWEQQLEEIENELKKYQDRLKRQIRPDDVTRLVEKPVRKISRFDLKEIEKYISKVEKEIKEAQSNLKNLTQYTITYLLSLKKRYGHLYPRKTTLTSFETIEATRVAASNAKLYANLKEGFIGTDLRRDEGAQFICDCSNLDDIIIFLREGTFMVTKLSEKQFIGKDIIHLAVFTRNDERTIYNVAYRDGKSGHSFVKRFAVSGVTRDRAYDITQGKAGSRVLWFTVNPNGEGEVIKVFLKGKPKLKKLLFEFDFANLAIRGRGVKGNILTKNSIHKIELKSKGVSQFGGVELWFDTDINRLNSDSRGEYLGEFSEEDRVLVICKDGTFYTSGFDLSNRFPGKILKVEKLNDQKIYSALYFEGASGYFYIKRFNFVESDDTPQLFISDSEGSYLHSISQDNNPIVEVTFGGKNQNRAPLSIDGAAFIAAKSFRAKGKRVSTLIVESLNFIEKEERDESGSEVKDENSSKEVVEKEGKESPTLF
ncbi:MAG: DNA gyrase/topoisomerase IV subunit A [Bacteroidales bacterium]